MSRSSKRRGASTRKPQRIMWLGVLIVAFLGLVVFSTTATSTNWFCTQPCHNVHDDNTLTFNAGSHVMMSCAACHEPFEGGIIAITLAKIEVAPDLIPTVLGTYRCHSTRTTPCARDG